METAAVYFDRPGPENTEATFSLARKRADELGIRSILVASTTGQTGVRAARFFSGYDLTVVTHVTGFKAPDTQELKEENRRQILEAGAKILTATHAFGGVGRAVRHRLNTYQVDEIIAHTLRIFCEGVKVAVEIALMAADAGLVRTESEVISIGGTARGADTALVLKPANTHNFFSLRVKEVICKPRL